MADEENIENAEQTGADELGLPEAGGSKLLTYLAPALALIVCFVEMWGTARPNLRCVPRSRP